MKNILKTILYSFIPLLVFLTLTEGLLSLFDLGRPFTGTLKMWGAPMELLEKDPYTIYRPKPNVNLGENMRLNSLGLRDDELNTSADFKILCLGDSVTFGWGVNDYHHTFSQRLEDELGQWAATYGKTVDVLNAGVPSYKLYQGFQLYLHYLATLTHWDTVILAFGWNEPLEEDEESEFMLRNPPTENPNIKRLRQTAEHFRSYNLLQSWWIHTALKTGEQKKQLVFDRYEKLLIEAIQTIRAHGSEIVLLNSQISPMDRGTALADAISRFNSINRKMASGDDGVTAVDTDSLFSQVPPGWYDPVHYDEDGHILTAKALFKSLVIKLAKSPKLKG